PTVAIARYIVFMGMALHDHPEYRQPLVDNDEAALHAFVQEVRRLFPFFPLVGARVLAEFTWKGYHFPVGTMALLDLYGTNRDPSIWAEPERFRPERFANDGAGKYQLIPQGGGDHWQNHRCAGEWITIRLMESAAKLMTQSMTYT